MKVAELARRSGISAHALRYYDDCGLLRATRTSAGYREFSESALREVRFIVMGRECGFSLAQIAELLPSYRARTLDARTLIELYQDRVDALTREIDERRALRRKLQAHIRWFGQSPAQRRQSPGSGIEASRSVLKPPKPPRTSKTLGNKLR